MSVFRASALGLCLIISGCQYFELKSNQFNSIKAIFSSKSRLQNGPNWSVEFAGYSSMVQPIINNTSVMFANNDSAVLFDGWSITQVTGMGGIWPSWEIRDSQGQRSFIVKGRVVLVHNCAPWVRYQEDEGFRFEQACDGERPYTNMILVNNAGQITNIEQVVDASLSMLRLRFNN